MMKIIVVVVIVMMVIVITFKVSLCLLSHGCGLSKWATVDCKAQCNWRPSVLDEATCGFAPGKHSYSTSL
jgi:hypothetical protein